MVHKEVTGHKHTHERNEGPQVEGWEVHPLTPDRWDDLAGLFGPRGACAGCWCMWWRLSGPQYKEGRGNSNREAFKRIVEAGEIMGLLGYADGKPAGWCAIAPRDAYERLRSERIRILKKVDDTPVWSVTCFFVARHYRGHGISELLLGAAVDYASEQGAEIVEGYPVDTDVANRDDASAYVGRASTFLKVGFVEVLRRHEARPIMRYFVMT